MPFTDSDTSNFIQNMGIQTPQQQNFFDQNPATQNSPPTQSPTQPTQNQPQNQTTQPPQNNGMDVGGGLEQIAQGNTLGALDSFTGGHLKSLLGKIFPGLQDLSQGGVSQWLKGVQQRTGPDTVANIQKQSQNQVLGFMGGDTNITDEVGKGLDTVAEDVGKIPGAINKAMNKAGDIISGGTSSENILATAPEDVSKLSLRDQQIWKNNALDTSKTQAQTELTQENTNTKENISNRTTQGGAERTQIAQDTQTQGEALTKKLADAKNGYTGASVNDINNMKEDGADLLSKKNAEFAKQRNAELTGFRRVSVTNQQIADVIKSEVGAPGDAAKVNEILGINKDNLAEKTNIAKIEQLSRDVRGMTPSAQRSGAGVFSPDSVFYNKAADVLDKVMENNGVDLSKSKSIWQEWAPVRNSLVKDFNVFDNQNFENDAAANMLKNRTEGIPGNYQNKLTAVEKELGRPLDQETSAAFKNLTSVQQEKAATEIKLELAKDASVNAQKDAIEQEKLDSQFRQGKITAAEESRARAINEKAINDRRAKIISNAIKLGGIGGTAAVVNYATGNKAGSAIGGAIKTLTGL